MDVRRYYLDIGGTSNRSNMSKTTLSGEL